MAKDDKTSTGKTCPEARISSPTKVLDDGHTVLDINTYIPYFLSSVNNALSSGASAQYLRDYGIGIVDWRVISMLSIEPGIPAARICNVVSLDKGATSRSLSKLSDMALVTFEAMENDPRRRIWTLSEAGYEMHDTILAAALERERQLIDGADPDDLEAFLRVIRVMRRNVDNL
ncbi:MarR family winged helix-turn-helix transcriptional regulator [Maritimibacter sp. DP4N28-5]|uniref:MarR family winged helix-turn-helix transcriptional regulator n=2 Tax=Maritimibacter dapengensis TaxID=2836868 RepID=A0ABS6T440_9RHOB|nr:MarR family winged helix-turn-helix transcriptional regulator [Maritimibacter dapengensis]